MKSSDIQKELRKHSFFSDLDEPVIQYLSSCATMIFVPNANFLFR